MNHPKIGNALCLKTTSPVELSLHTDNKQSETIFVGNAQIIFLMSSDLYGIFLISLTSEGLNYFVAKTYGNYLKRL